MVKTFSWCSPLEETKQKMQPERLPYKGELKAARRNELIDNSDLQSRKSLDSSADPGSGSGNGFLTSFHHSTACGSGGLQGCRLALRRF
ncbi:MAG: hypothetical protein FWC45_03030 [Treponema sp.]|nr:hypothetical protein [Treponema sp.]